MQEVIVTAEKRQASVNTVPMTVVAATGAQLESLGIKEARDLVKITPSLTYTEYTPGLPIYTVRGVGFYDLAAGGRGTVAIYVDEAPLTFPLETRGADLDLERVEVLKGPQGILFGQNATGGAINYIAAKPTPTFEAGGTVSYGNYNATDIEGYVSGPITDTLLARVAVEHTGMDGWQTSYTTGEKNGEGDFTNARLLLDWKPNDHLHGQLNINGFIDHSESQALQYIGYHPSVPFPSPNTAALANFPPSPLTPTAANFNPDEDYHRHNNFFQINARLDYQFSGGTLLTSLTSFSKYHENQNIDLDGTTLSDLQNDNIANITSVSQELRLSGQYREKGHYLVGINYAYDEPQETDNVNLSQSNTAYVFSSLGLPLLNTLRDINHQTENTYAIFGNTDYQLLSNVKAYAGVRYTRTTDTFTGCTADTGDGSAAAAFGGFENFFRGIYGLAPNAPIPPGGCINYNASFVPTLIHSRLDQDNVSWRVGLEWTPIKRMLLYANATKGFKAGGYPVLAASTIGQYAPATQESVVAYEAGFKLTLLDRTLQLNGAGFYYDYRNKQLDGYVLDPIQGPIQKLINIPKSSITGAEIQLDWRPIKGLTLGAGASYIDSQILDNFTNYTAFGASQNFNGEAFPNTPKWQMSANAEYIMDLNDRLDGFIGGNLRYQSATNSQLGELSQLGIDSYTLVDLRGGIESKDSRWRLMLWSRNIGDTYYWITATKNLDTIGRYAGMPRTFGVTLSFHL